MTSDVDFVILSTLGREPSMLLGHSDTETGPSPVALLIKGVKYYLTSSTVDILLEHTSSSLQAARIIFAVREAATERPSPNTEDEAQPVIEFAAHTFSRPQGSPAHNPRTITTIIDTDALHASSQPTRALRASTIPSSPRPATQKPTLRDTYHAYIATINAGAAAMTSRLAEFCHPVVTHNGQPLSIPRYQRLMEDAQEAIPDMTFHVADLVADEEKQQLAARLQFTGTPVKTWLEMEPNGDAVDFSEQVFYWFEEGRIRSVVSVVDTDAFRHQMSS